MCRLKGTNANCKASTKTQYNTNAQKRTLNKGNKTNIVTENSNINE